MPHVAVIGHHPTEFLHQLQVADYSHTKYATYSQFTPKPNEPPVAVSIHGVDASAGLESTEDVLKLLNTNAILLLFSPSLALLQAVKKAIKTPVDLPKLKFEEGKPLIVHKMHGVNRYHIVPGFSLATKQGESPGDRASRLAKFSVDLIGKCVAFASNPAVVSQLLQDKLDPPSDASFVYRPAPVSWYYEVGNGKHSRTSQWFVYLHAFATEDKPSNPSNCWVYTIMRFAGGADSGPPSDASHRTFSLDYQVSASASSSAQFSWAHQEPQSYQRKDQSGFQYDIEYNQDFNLFKDEGDTPYPWTATYSENFQQVEQQVPSQPDGATCRFSITLDDYINPFVYRGLLVGQCRPTNNLGLAFTVSSNSDVTNYLPSLNLTFA